jgi:Zn-dependent peptidase ImmA (M78 family)
MKVDWDKLRKSIPSRVHVKRGVYYDVLWIEKNREQQDWVGITQLDTKQIIMELGHSDKETVHTYLHELAHAFSHEYELGLTESQVRRFEKATYYMLKSGNVLKGK